MSNPEQDPIWVRESIQMTLKLVDQALGPRLFFDESLDRGAMEILSRMSPLEAPENMVFRVVPSHPGNGLTVFIKNGDKEDQRVLSSLRYVRDFEIDDPLTFRRDIVSNMPAFDGTILEFDTVAADGRFYVVSHDGLKKVICNPYFNSTQLVDYMD